VSSSEAIAVLFLFAMMLNIKHLLLKELWTMYGSPTTPLGAPKRVTLEAYNVEPSVER
jgi:hypothetical protein